MHLGLSARATRRTMLASMAGAATLVLSTACGAVAPPATVPRPSLAKDNGSPLVLGYFPNVTHAAALVGVARGTFQSALGPSVKLDTRMFNAGPALVEALFAGDVDLGYVGPNPAVNGFVKSKGKALRLVAGAASGGTFFVVRPDAGIATAKDLNGKTLATPQLGGTQDVALRGYLKANGLKSADKGGTVQITPMQNGDIVTLFKQGKIHGAWVPEPWASLLVQHSGGQIFVDERTLWPGGKFATTTIVARTRFLQDRPSLLRPFLEAHVETVQFINANLDQAKRLVNEQIERTTSQPLASDVIDMACANVDVTQDPLAKSVLTAADNAFALGFLGENKPELSAMFDLDTLNQVLVAAGLPTVSAS